MQVKVLRQQVQTLEQTDLRELANVKHVLQRELG
jgi:hypothetical protein